MRPPDCRLCWLAVLAAVLLSACGQKGALYLPKPNQTPSQSISEGVAQ